MRGIPFPSAETRSFFDVLSNPFNIPGPKGLELLPFIFGFRKNAIPPFMDGFKKYGDLVFYPLWQTGHFSHYRFFYQVNHPHDIHHVLLKNHTNYTKSKNYKKLQPLLGQGLLTSEGSIWRTQRGISQPVFQPQAIARFLKPMTLATQDAIKGLHQQNQQNKSIDIAEEMMALTLRIAGETFFSCDLSAEASVVGSALTIAIESLQKRVVGLINLPDFLPTPENIRLKNAIKTLHRVVDELIHIRMQELNPPIDLLTMLIRITDEEGKKGLTPRELRDSIMTFFLAGHETTANALAWTLYCLAKHPTVQNNVRDEITHVLHNGSIEMDTLDRLPYTEMVIQESMRLYPPAWIIERNSIHHDEISGYPIPPDSLIVISPYVVHRHPKFWDKPDTFRPERFSPENKDNIHPHAYIPFGLGPRQCIGKHFAMMELKVILPLLLQAFRFQLPRGFKVELDPKITLRPRHGIPMVLTRI